MNAIRRDCEQFDETDWKNCCTFHANPDNHDPNYKITIKGLHRKILPYQAYAVYGMLKAEGTEPGGLLEPQTLPKGVSLEYTSAKSNKTLFLSLLSIIKLA